MRIEKIPVFPDYKLREYSPRAIGPDTECFVDAKIDGEFNLYDNASRRFVNKNGLSRSDFPAMSGAEKLCEELKTGKSPISLYCELHWNAGKAGDLYDFLAHKESHEINCAVFDYSGDSSSLLERRHRLAQAFSQTSLDPHIYLVPFRHCKNREEISAAVCGYEAEGYEGVVIKPAWYSWINNGGFKMKSKATSDLKVLSVDPWRERIGVENPLLLGSELCGVKVPNRIKGSLKTGIIVEIEYLQKLYDKAGILTGLRNPILKRIRTDKTEVSL